MNTVCQSGCSSYREVGVRGIAAVGSLAGITILILLHILKVGLAVIVILWLCVDVYCYIL